MPPKRALTINAGSSSIKFATFAIDAAPRRIISGQIERMGGDTPSLSAKTDDGRVFNQPVKAGDVQQAGRELLDWLDAHGALGSLSAVGHRIVHGGPRLLDHQLITPRVLRELKDAQAMDLVHLPSQIALIEAIGSRLANLPQVACFDTAFHRDMPRVARLLPIPRKYDEAGFRRFGFHGLSYAYLLEELTKLAPSEADGRVIFAHLGSGASMAAVRGGQPFDTTMGFTPLAGLVMGTRPGDLDPGLLAYLIRAEKMTPDRLDAFVNHECGLRGISGTSADMRDLSARRATDRAADDAIALFCYRARQWIGALATTMGGLEALVFAGGIGEHAADIRTEICSGLSLLGIEIDVDANGANRWRQSVDAATTRISTLASRVCVRVIPTDEEVMIARIVAKLTA